MTHMCDSFYAGPVFVLLTASYTSSDSSCLIINHYYSFVFELHCHDFFPELSIQEFMIWDVIAFVVRVCRHWT